MQLPNKIEQILYKVEKHGRYVGGEYNQVCLKIGMQRTYTLHLHPDIYDLGQPNLGLAILYDLINQREDMLAERNLLARYGNCHASGIFTSI